MRLRHGIFFLALLLPLVTFAEGAPEQGKYIFDHLGFEDGLQGSHIYSVMESADGAMWFSSKNSVFRYNGQVIAEFPLTVTNNLFSSGSGRTTALFSGEAGNICAFDNKGNIFRYNPATDSFVEIYALSGEWQGDAIILGDVLYDESGQYWLGMNSGLYSMQRNGTVTCAYEGIYVNQISQMDGRLVLCTNTGIRIYNPSDGSCGSLLEGTPVQSAWYDAASGLLWAGTFNNGVKLLNPSIGAITSELESNSHAPVRDIEPINDTTVIFGIDGKGIFTATRDGRPLERMYRGRNTDGGTLNSNSVYDICVDRWGNLWIGNYTGGVDVIFPASGLVEFIRPSDNTPESLPDAKVNDVLQSKDGHLWFATDNGVSECGSGRRWRHILPGEVVLTLTEEADGNILAGTYGTGVYRIRREKNLSATPLYNMASGTLATDYVYSLLHDSEGNLWIGCLNGPVVRIDNKGKIDTYDIQVVQCMSEMPDGRIAIGTANGFWVIDPKDNSQSHFFSAGEFPGRDINCNIQQLLFKPMGNEVWVASEGGGIYLYNLTSRSVIRITTDEGLPSNSVYSLAYDCKGRIVAGTDRGLVRIEPDNGMLLSNINFVPGLENEYSRSAVRRLGSGRLLLGSNNGAVLLNTDIVDKLEYSASLQLKRLRLLNDGTIFTGENTCLRYDQNTFTIEFESICFNFQHDIAYQYMLEGYDAEWAIPTQRQEVQYTNIRPGRYTFRVRGISRHNGRILDEKVIAIKVARPWWNSVYAWIFYLSMLSATILLAWRYFYSRVERRYFDEKIDFFIHTAHDIRTPLSLVLAPLEDLGRNGSLDEDGKRYLSIARRNGDKLMSMIGRLLDFQKSDLTGTPLKMEIFNLKAILTSVVEKFVPLASQKTISLTLDSCPDECLIKADGELIDKVMDNLVSNAIKYTGSGGEVHLRAWTKPRTVYIEVADNGIGIPLKAQKNIFQRFYRADNAVNMQETGSGIGLLLSRRLVQLHGGFLSFRSSEGEGTVFRISLPLETTSESSDAVIREDVPQPDHIWDIAAPMAEESREVRELSDRDTILFVDDNEELCSYVRLSFRNYYNVVTYTNPIDALQYLRDGGICDILVSDVMMPEMPGDELCRSIKENPETQWLPVILLTARSGRDFMIEGLGKGADDYVVKPFDPAILRSRIDTLLANRRRLSSYYLDRSAELTRDGMSAEATPEICKGASEADRLFVDKATRTVIEHIADVEFSVDTFCREMAMSRTLLYGRLKTLTSHSPQDFIRFIRLEKAASLLREGTSVMDVSIMTGFVNSKHFSTVFKRQYGVSPSRFCQN